MRRCHCIQAKKRSTSQCGVAKGTISKAIKTGKLSATRREDGSWSIDNAELARYLEANGHRFRSETVDADQPETGGGTSMATDALVAELRGMIRDLREDRDHWRTVAERLSLTAQKPAEQLEKPMTWWRWLRTTG
jgi:hypothetical protein